MCAFTPFKDMGKNFVLTGDGDGQNPKNSGRNTLKSLSINYENSPKNIPVPISIIEYTAEGVKLIQD